MAQIEANSVPLPKFDLTGVAREVALRNAELLAGAIVVAEGQYRDFLRQYKINPSLATPSKLAELFWREHHANSRKYTKDCMSYFGFVLEHPENPIQESFCDPTIERVEFNLSEAEWI